MQSNYNMRTANLCPHNWFDFLTYSSPDLILPSVQSPGVPALQQGPLVPLIPVIYVGHQTGKYLHKQLARKETKYVKLNICLVLVKDRYMKAFGYQTTAILVPQNNKYPFLLIEFFLKMLHNNVMILTQYLFHFFQQSNLMMIHSNR